MCFVFQLLDCKPVPFLPSPAPQIPLIRICYVASYARDLSSKNTDLLLKTLSGERGRMLQVHPPYAECLADRSAVMCKLDRQDPPHKVFKSHMSHSHYAIPKSPVTKQKKTREKK